ncbi:MAG TPA: hypothetical protein VIQ29_13430 [Ancylobacter sp.]
MATALATQQRITASVNGENPEGDRLEKALSVLWAPLDGPSSRGTTRAGALVQ